MPMREGRTRKIENGGFAHLFCKNATELGLAKRTQFRQSGSICFFVVMGLKIVYGRGNFGTAQRKSLLCCPLCAFFEQGINFFIGIEMGIGFTARKVFYNAVKDAFRGIYAACIN